MNEFDREEHANLRNVIGDLKERLARIDERMVSMGSRVEAIEKNTTNINAQMNKWKGAAPVILAAGAVAGWLLTSWDSVRGLFR